MGDHRHLLVIDWDTFFVRPDQALPEYRDLNPCGKTLFETYAMYDWDHAETPFHRGPVWTGRSYAFTAMGLDLPTVHVPDGWIDRFRIAEGSRLVVADSNTHAGEMLDGGKPWYSVWLYDAHHDSGYRVKSVAEWRDRLTYSCEDWMLRHFDRGSKLNWRWPWWLDNRKRQHSPKVKGVKVDSCEDLRWPWSIPPVTFHGVFVCRSGAWVPPWCDDQFTAFVDSIAARMGTTPKDVEGCSPRAWNVPDSPEDATRKMLGGIAELLGG